LGLLHPSLPEGRVDKKCLVETVWSRCSIRVKLGYRQLSVIALGGFDTWKGGSPAIDVKNEYLMILKQPKIIEKLNLLPRISGWSFNPNAFAALLVVMCLLAIIFSNWWWLSMSTLLMSLFGIMVSGSRSAFIAIASGFLTLLLMRTRFYRITPLLSLIVTIGVVIFQTALVGGKIELQAARPQPEMRSLNMIDKDTTRTRLEIWRLASKAWLENPKTFIFGTGDLTKAMKSKLDTRAIGFGLSAESITHAHNLWLQTAGQNGLLGLFVMLGLWILIIWQAWKAKDAGSLALMIAIFVINSLDYLFYYAPIHICFWIAALGFQRKMIDNAVEDKITIPFRTN
jgi:O-antigen ligase